MRLSAIALRLGVFALAAGASVIGARAAVTVVEQRSAEAVEEVLREHGQEWATVISDGLQVIIEGEAPTEAVRFRTMSLAGTVVDASRVIDNMSVEETEGLSAPEFAVEILRNDAGISLIGLLPASADRERIDTRIKSIAGGQPLRDLLQTADYPMPAGWRPAMTYALDALAFLPRSKVSVSPGRVEVTAISDSPEEQSALIARLNRIAPEGIEVVLDISAPRPVITPFVTRFVIDERGPRFDACAAGDEAAAARIVVAAEAAGLPEGYECTLGLGQPSSTYGEAVALSIKALADLGGGTVTISDADIQLTAAEGTDPATFDDVVGTLDNALPDLFSLDAVLPVVPDASAEGPPTFTATLSPEGLVQLRGKVSGDLMNTTVETFAMAQFGTEGNLTLSTRPAENLPADWSVRVLAGIEALSLLHNGAVIVTPEDLTVRGNSGRRRASDEISALLIDKLGDDARFEIDVTYVEALDPIALMPTAEECIEKILAVTSARKIIFEPGSATIDPSAQPIVDDIAEILRRCPDLKIEIAGYTDSQGREEMNQALSQQRAEAVLTVLRGRRVPTSNFVAVGYGEADPIADNDTEEGREANRRIEFRLIQPEPIEEDPTALEEIEAAAAEAAAQGEGAEEAAGSEGETAEADE